MHKVKTVIKYAVSSWKNSGFVVKMCPTKKRILVYFDLIYWFVRYGHDFNDYCTFKFWEKSSSERKSYISLRRNDVLRFALSTPRVYNLFLDKSAFNKRFSKYIKRGFITTEDHSWSEIEEFVHHYKNVIVKPLSDFGGHGVLKITSNSNNYPLLLQTLKDIVNNRSKYIIEETIENCDEISQIAPSSLNTLRFVTVIDKNNQLHIIASLLRMGNGFSVTDNYHDAGMACAIDIETGQMKGSAYGMNCISYDEHPYSKVKFDGFRIPHYFECLEAIKEIAFVEPEARYVGWDIAITPNGIELLEGNIPPGEDITQIATGCGMWYSMQEWI